MNATEPRGDVAPIDLATLDLDSFAGRSVAVLGLARSGVALTRFLSDRGALVTIYDGRPADELSDRIEELAGRSFRAMLGPRIDPADALAGQSLVCTSPSVNSRYPTTEPRLRAALRQLEQERRIPVVSEIDLFMRLCPALTVGVTGTKGKTTTSSLAAAVLAAAARPVHLGGNIGTPLVERLPALTADETVVLELSELQLPTLSRGPVVGVYTHVSSDHLDRHGTLEAYRAAKRRLAELLPPEGRLVLNAEDPVSAGWAEASAAPALRYSRAGVPPGGVGIEGDWIVAEPIEPIARAGGGAAMLGPGGRIMPLGEVGLRGWHNASNVLAAVAVGLSLGIAADAIRRAVAAFGGVEHRLETVAVIDGVRFVNDSAGTQPDAVVAALRSFEQPLVLICGGRSKDESLDALAQVVARRASAVVLIGETAPTMAAAFADAGAANIERAADLPSAVVRADTLVRELRADKPELSAGKPAAEATVLLSPAATSFDMFADYAARGRAFRAAVEAIAAQRASGAGAGEPTR